MGSKHHPQKIPGAARNPEVKKKCTHVIWGSQNARLEKQLKVSRHESWSWKSRYIICTSKIHIFMHLLNNPIYHLFKRDYKIRIQICLSSSKRHTLYTRCTDENREIDLKPKSSPTIQLQVLPIYNIDKIQSSIWLSYQKAVPFQECHCGTRSIAIAARNNKINLCYGSLDPMLLHTL